MNLLANKLAFAGEEKLAQELYVDAQTDLEKALELKTTAYEGLNRKHLLIKDTTRTRAALAFSLQSQGKLTDAETHYRLVISAIENNPDERVNYAKTLLNFSDLLSQIGKAQEAEKYCDIAVPILKEAFPEHEFYAAALANQAIILSITKKYDQAIQSANKSLQLFQRILGRDNNNTISCVRILATLYKDTNQQNQREELLKEWSDYRSSIFTEEEEKEESEMEQFENAPEFQKIERANEHFAKNLSDENIDKKLEKFDRYAEKYAAATAASTTSSSASSTTSSTASSSSSSPSSTPLPSPPQFANPKKVESIVQLNNRPKGVGETPPVRMENGQAVFTKDMEEISEPLKKWMENMAKPKVDTSSFENVDTSSFDPSMLNEMKDLLGQMQSVNMRDQEEMARFQPKVNQYVDMIKDTLEKSGQKVPELNLDSGMSYDEMVDTLQSLMPATESKFEFDPSEIDNPDAFNQKFSSMLSQLGQESDHDPTPKS